MLHTQAPTRALSSCLPVPWGFVSSRQPTVSTVTVVQMSAAATAMTGGQAEGGEGGIEVQVSLIRQTLQRDIHRRAITNPPQSPRAEIQPSDGLCQQVHGKGLHHQSGRTELVNGLISTHYTGLLGTWAPFRALRAVGQGEGKREGWHNGKKANKRSDMLGLQDFELGRSGKWEKKHKNLYNKL
ncbi:hypothetical protein WMY93_013202 [Mugilogobius chulae]|uniref:Uncharacterized protein n=1 Tax=Mugilogobius chulae TaxID=88201 RepID=A0AAW0PBQ4_9GOBI